MAALQSPKEKKVKVIGISSAADWTVVTLSYSQSEMLDLKNSTLLVLPSKMIKSYILLDLENFCFKFCPPKRLSPQLGHGFEGEKVSKSTDQSFGW